MSRSIIILTLLSILCFSSVNLKELTLDEQIQDAESVVQDIANEMLGYYKNVCSDKCDCSEHGCSNLSPKLSCNEDFPDAGCPSTKCKSSKRNMKKSIVHFSNKFEKINKNDDKIVQATCYTNHYNDKFRENYKNNKSIMGQYFGTSDGLFRYYPALPNCGPYDHRVRPWYAQATSDPKNIIILYENSSYMTTGGRASLARQLVSRILDTVSNTDHIAFISFNERTLALEPYFVTGSSAAKSRILNHVDGLVGFDGANFMKGVEDVYEYIRKSNVNGSLLNADILFATISSGIINKGDNNNNSIINKITNLNSVNSNGFTVNARAFPFLVGTNNSSVTMLRSFACNNLGLFKHVVDASNVNDAVLNGISKYLNLNMKTPNLIWTEPYLDNSGLGQVITAAKSVYDSSVTPAKLVGVAAIDIILGEMLALTDIDSLVNTLMNRSRRNFFKNTLTNCELDQLRQTADKCYDAVTYNVSCPGVKTLEQPAVICNSLPTNTICGEDEAVYQELEEHEFDYRCCVDCITFNRDAIISSIVIALGLLIIIIILLCCICCKNNRISELENNKSEGVAMDTQINNNRENPESDKVNENN